MHGTTTERIRNTIWSKLLLNLGSGLLAVLTGTTASVFFGRGGLPRGNRSVLAEGAAIAAAMGCHVQPHADGQIRNGSASHHKTSILQDFELGRPMEIDSLLTVPLEMARAHGAATWWPWSAAGRAGQVGQRLGRPSSVRLHIEPDRSEPRPYPPAMSFFESLLVLLLVAVVLLQLSRRMALPYPALLAVAGVAVAFIPGVPAIRMDPNTALALFIAPVLLDAAYDFPVSVAGALWRPMLVLATGVTLATAAAVAFIGWWAADMPIAAALVLGAIVAPPDAAAAVAVLGSVSLPRRTIGVLKGESLFNDAVALLLFTGALTTQARGGLDGWTELQMVVAVPGGIVLGIALGAVMRRVSRFVANTLGGNMLQFLSTYLAWIVAEHLGLSAVLAVVAYAMTLARWADVVGSPRMRVHSMAVWASVVFLLNVLAFLLMGMQARLILARIPQDDLWHAARIVGLVLLVITVTRFVLVMLWNQVAARFPRLRGPLPPPTVGQGVVVAWSGMRGLVTLATSFALPSGFPQRDLIILIAFAVVLVTLVVQGLTLAPLIRLLRLDRMESPVDDLHRARRRLAQVGLEQVDAVDAAHDLSLGTLYRLKCNDAQDAGFVERLQDHRRLGLAVTAAQRQILRQMRDRQEIDIDVYYKLQEEIDWRELTLLPDQERQILEA